MHAKLEVARGRRGIDIYWVVIDGVYVEFPNRELAEKIVKCINGGK